MRFVLCLCFVALVCAQFEDVYFADFRIVDYVVNMSVAVTYHVQQTARLSFRVVVPYVTSTTMSKERYPYCPTTYLIDFSPPVDDTSYTAVPTRDEIGTPKTSCAAYDFIYKKENFDFPDLGGTQTYPLPPQPLDCGRPSNAWYCNTPVAWRRTVDVAAELVVYESDVDTNHIANFKKACRSLKDDAAVFHVTTRLVNLSLPDLNEPFVVEVETYEWDLYVCAVGPHGPGCVREEYAFSCKRFPAKFESNAVQLSSVAALQVGCAFVKSSLTFESASPFRDAACLAGWERLRITFLLDMIDTPKVIRLIHPVAFSESKVMLNASRIIVETPCFNTEWSNERRFNAAAFIEQVSRNQSVGFEFFFSVNEPEGQTCNYTGVVVVSQEEFMFETPFAFKEPSFEAKIGLTPGLVAVGSIFGVGGIFATTKTFLFAESASDACKTCTLPKTNQN